MSYVKEEVKTEEESLQYGDDDRCLGPVSPAPEFTGKMEIKKEEFKIFIDPDSDFECGSGNENGARQQVQEDIASVSQSLQFAASSSNLADMKTQRQQSVGSVCRPCSVVLHRVAWETLDTAGSGNENGARQQVQEDIASVSQSLQFAASSSNLADMKTQRQQSVGSVCRPCSVVLHRVAWETQDTADSADKNDSSQQTQAAVTVAKKSFECAACFSTFTDKKTLSKHKTSVCRKKLIPSSKMLKRFKCNTCPKQYTRKDLWIFHMAVHTGLKPYECEVCHKKFTSKSNLKSHALTHAKVKPFVCDICSKQFTRKVHLEFHMAVHTGLKPHECQVCQKKFTHKANLKSHALTHAMIKPLVCDICSKRFCSKNSIKAHVASHMQPIHQCGVCHRRFTREGGLKCHMTSHSLPQHECNICFKLFAQKSGLKLHVLNVHQGVKPFACQQCDKTFPNRNGLKRHKLSHTGEKPFACEICFKRFAQRNGLTVHMASHAQPQFQCDICFKRFTQKSVLVNHMVSHLLPQHECNISLKHFSRKSNWDEDVLNLHQGGKPYDCQLCDKKFTSKYLLNSHNLTQTCQKAFACNICPKRFSKKDTLKLHLAAHKLHSQLVT